ncbi:MAG: TatD family deoxyribonuclease [Clostridiales bacterium]|nr:TatD family deoxyribonuclease [Clostridiales bacterium]
MLFDSHAHLNDRTYAENREALFAAIEASDLSYVCDVGFDLESSLLAVEHAQKLPWCYAVVGCHPHDSKEMDESMMTMFKGLAKKPKVVAIGEMGLDYHYDHSPRDIQQHWFRRQLQLALELKMPIVIHDRDAHDDVLRILKEEGVLAAGKEPAARVLLHCFSGSPELAAQYVKLGAWISMAGPITFKNARKAPEVIAAVPDDRLLAETDSPFLTPEPFRGKRNSPVNVEYTVRKIAEIKGITYESAAALTLNNAKAFYGIK